MITIEGVTFRYAPGQALAVEDASFTVGPSEVVGIIGPNGSGKSTTARLMKGLILPETGRVTVDGLDTHSEGLQVRRKVGLVFQNPNSQIVNAIVEQEVAFGPENLGLQTAEIRARVTSALSDVGLPGSESAECHSLSMADKQRVALAGVLAMEPSYLVLDEPTTWLEPAARAALLRDVLRWAQGRNAGIVLVTHRMDEALLCHRVVGMRHGKIEVIGPPTEILADPRTRERLSLAVPEAFALVSSLRDAGLPVSPYASLESAAEAICTS